ncbi:MAG: ribose-phosphate pyrophosphokinase-like domain-containing protein, partial [Clostridia bacterium]|nr:ribose-phosphate pyrophosphokinase-like domain-containing protein [Clostridia bacterium]
MEKLQSVGPLGLVAMPGAKELGDRVNYYLKLWRTKPENGDPSFASDPGLQRSGEEKEDFLIHSRCPRFSNGEAKGIIHETVRGYDLYFMCDVGNYGVTYPMYGA